jgi:site-specific recombinase XerD
VAGRTGRQGVTTLAPVRLAHIEPSGAPGTDRTRLPVLLEQVLRPEFRPFLLFAAVGDEVLGHPPCKVPACGRPGPMVGLCAAHLTRWYTAGKPPIEEWAATAAPAVRGRSPLLSCIVNSCRRGRAAYALCALHHAHWIRAGRPPVESWLASVAPVVDGDRLDCAVDRCQLLAESARSALCREHGDRWRGAGRPPLPVFSDWCAAVGQHCFDLRQMPPGLARELQYGLQCRSEERAAKAVPRDLRPLIRYLSDAQPDSLLDEPAEVLLARMPPSGRRSTLAAFVRFTIRCLEDLLAGIGWDNEYGRDQWVLRRLNLKTDNTATIYFVGIAQPWLRELAKRWCRHRLVTGLTPSTVACGARAVASLAQHLEKYPAAGPRTAGAAGLDRQLLEGWLASLSADLGPPARRLRIGAVATFLQAIRQHQWAPDLPAGAVIVAEDYPRRAAMLPRALPEYVMAQLESPANLARITDPRIQLVTELIMRTGLRLRDALTLPTDCLLRDHQEGTYFRYVNRKMRREAVVPIDDALGAAITAQQQAVRDRWADSPVLFPRSLANPDGKHPVGANAYYDQLGRWLVTCNIHDEQGHPVHLTPHQWRHTFATRLINQEVPLEVVRRLLDHTSHATTSHYARICDTTVRQHWERARKVNHRGEPLTLAADSPLADAAWMKQNIARATMALPNGYCGLPLRQKCPHANACLDCPVFVTTAEFLPQHHSQLDATRTLIATAEADGHFRMVEMNQRVADNLEAIITTLEHPAEQDADES